MPILHRCLLLSMCAFLPIVAHARPALAPAQQREQHVAQLFRDAAAQPAQLRTWLQAMPKGGDLHNHLSGSVYAEDYLQWASDDGACVQLSDLSLRAPPCGAGQEPASGLAARNAALYGRVVDSLSMRKFLPSPAQPTGHDQFFSTFGKFDAVVRTRVADTVAAVLEQAARDRVPYVEIIANPPQMDQAAKRMQALQWKGDDDAANLRALQADLPPLVQAAQRDLADIDAQIRRVLHCDQADARPGCTVDYRYVPYVLRVLPQPMVFGQMALAHALIAAGTTRAVALNIVAPEDNPVALADYARHMAMFRFFATRYPGVPLSLHAGELTLGLVPPAQLRSHIRQALDAGARRIGHGVDLPYEEDADALLQRMRREQIAVEINLTSNDVILGVKGAAHPLALYLRAGVPVVLSTDDAGVSRADMTHEYQRAMQEQGIDYPTLKQLARNGLSYSFLPGASLWTAEGAPASACATAVQRETDDATCRDFRKSSEKARLQWQLETDLAQYERTLLAQRR
ncbi:TPA: adenosine deaminase [Xanthomonas vasicola pv. zeae]|uniref:adenosine deaminase n=2 Tax=Xanthomonas vasicola pv. vasculorum TaxID=325776 RepID=A0AAE8F312_XANVA|nr:adenosine deaminase [Xanthomonas vasicola]AVQ05516.1 adenosine deaminase [Xanthomonas vasicola pv. vasculorum]AZM69715.1 adenosine deaminase [Xanthomonas vasicola pv. vasculorum]KEZ96576.1 adenosine deaminase [Xanthomonas vasicola pv. vasculorum NCPPB 895]KFA29328.1 adenosine deaminase [Xanthomonas vasicola pv. vasculorum NCPPB 1381]KFA31259.1 adenosine deaminase [Xanthomonas vasicola pv. vasculorum NCPPB 1326]